MNTIWITFWIVTGILWAWYALLDYYFVNNKGMSMGWEVLNILLNTLFLPIGLFFGIFVFIVENEVEGGDTSIDFVVIKLMTEYKAMELDDKED